MILTKLNCARGAPMGRAATHRTGLTRPRFDLERVPLIDGGYDCGGAYWGTGACAGNTTSLWWADFTTPLTNTVIVSYFIRARDREHAMELVRETYKDAEFTQESGDIVEQTITYLQAYLDQLDAMADEEDDQTEVLVAELVEQLDEIRRPK